MSESTIVDDIYKNLNALETRLDALDALVSGWTRSAFTYPDFEFLKADRAEFVEPPLESAYFVRTSSLTLSTGSWITISFDTVLYNTGLIGYSTTSTGLFTHPHPANLESFFLFGTLTFFAGTGGHTSVRLNIQPSGTVVVSQLIADTATQNFAYFYRADGIATGFNVQIWRGGSVDPNAVTSLTNADFSVIKLARQ